eukprot:Sspe_Gene.11794::Locus_4002_Transcript_1_3_Confidence_0.500_Length_2467::g.11794::m.11794
MSAADPPQKKRKVELLSPFVDGLYGNAARYQKMCSEGTPYAHAVVDPLCKQDRMAAITEEVTEKLTATFKETDLFKLYQTLDLANLDEEKNPEVAKDLRPKLPNLVALRDELYSENFRKFIQEITGCKELTNRVDMSLQAYGEGGHLLCHDDVIGTRAVSFIIYLTDPSYDIATDGGALELYASKDGLPENTPVKAIPPKSNTMVIFPVTPGVSYHAVGEVLSDRAPRLSIQGWFHAADVPEGAEARSSLAQLKGRAHSSRPFTRYDPPLPMERITSLSDEDMAFLSEWVAPEYLTPAAWPQIRERFAVEGSVQLRGFLKNQVSLPRESGDWEEVGPPIIQRYLRSRGSTPLDKVKDELFTSAPFARLLGVLTSLVLLGHREEVRMFRKGTDYTVAHVGLLEPDTRLDATLCVVKDDEAWETGDVGGFECFLATEDEQLVAAEVYGGGDDSDGLLSIHPSNNTLSLVARDEDVMKFVKYVSALAPSSRADVSAVYEILCDASEEESDGSDGDVDGDDHDGED